MCVAHVHSTLSDGTATVAEIAAAASKAGADAVLLTDHDTLEAQRRGLAGRHGDVLVVVGVEVSSASGHLLAFGLTQEVDHRDLAATEIWSRVRDAGGIGFAAHPVSEGSRMSRNIGRPHPWTDLDGCSGIGMELWSLVTDAAEAWSNPCEALRFLRSPELTASAPPARALAEWDRLGATRRIPALGGLDAHQTGVRIAGRVVSPMPHERYFQLLQTHVVCTDSDRACVTEAAVLEALGKGHAFLARPWIAPARGFRFWAERPDAVVAMGDEAAISSGWTLRCAAPHPARLRLLRDGVAIKEVTGDVIEFGANEPGVYRLEARRDAHGGEQLWILSNPVYLR